MTGSTRRDAAMARIRARLVWVAAFLVLLSAFSFLGDRHWTFELLSHFRVQFAAAAMVLAGTAALLRRRRMAALLAVLAVIHGVQPASYILAAPWTNAHAAADEPDSLSLTVSYHNLHHRTADYGALLRHLKREQPDIIVLTEMDYRRRADLFHGLRRGWSHFSATPGPSIFNVAVFSRHPLTEVSRMLDTAHDWPMLHVRVCPDEERRCLRVVTLHARPPLGPGAAAVRNAAMREAAAEAANSHESVIIVGDLNCTPWSPHFRKMLAEGRVRDGNRAGLAATWGLRSPLLGLPIDHILTGPAVSELSREIGPSFGSDHFMLTAELKFAAPRLAPSPAAP